MADPDYYEILDVSSDATGEEIKEAYRRAVRTAHPDAGGTAGMFRLVSQAYETLRDPEKRAAYDRRNGRSDGPPADYAGDADSGDPTESDWGEEFTWDVDEQFDVRDPPRERLLKWAARSEHARQLWRVGWIVSSILFVVFAYLLIFPDFIKPAAAGPDIFSWLLQQPLITVVFIGIYVVIARPVSILALEASVGPHLIYTVGLLAWPLAYWGIAETSERQIYSAVIILWLIYNAALFVTGVVAEAMMRQRNSRS